MSVIKCKAVSCAHNSDCQCVRKHIDVCAGSGDCSIIFCATYKPRRREEISELKNEIGRSDFQNCCDTCISCSAAGCIHNKDGACMENSIHISHPETIKNRKCLCDSFEP